MKDSVRQGFNTTLGVTVNRDSETNIARVPTLQIVISALSFQGLWFDMLYFQTGLAVIPLLIMSIQLSIVFKGMLFDLLPRLLCLIAVGVSLDSAISFLDIYQFPKSGLLVGWIPLWLVVLWVGFVLSLPIAFSSLLNKPLFLTALFAGLAPVSYIAGRAFGMLEFVDAAVWIIGLAWAVVGFLSAKMLGPKLAPSDNQVEE